MVLPAPLVILMPGRTSLPPAPETILLWLRWRDRRVMERGGALPVVEVKGGRTLEVSAMGRHPDICLFLSEEGLETRGAYILSAMEKGTLRPTPRRNLEFFSIRVTEEDVSSWSSFRIFTEPNISICKVTDRGTLPFHSLGKTCTGRI
jgi:hypothetical protein